jgi:hypothetical protein
MPLLRYFGFAGSALALLLFGLSWYFPQPVSEPVRSGIDGPVSRVFGGAGASAVMVPVLMVTVCPFVIEVELRLMS